MNCECVYYSKNATREELMKVAEVVREWEKECEIYPVALSKITKATKMYPDIDHWGRGATVSAESEVLFVAGKLHYMLPVRVGRKVFLPRFPEWEAEDFFEDIESFE